MSYSPAHQKQKKQKIKKSVNFADNLSQKHFDFIKNIQKFSYSPSPVSTEMVSTTEMATTSSLDPASGSSSGSGGSPPIQQNAKRAREQLSPQINSPPTFVMDITDQQAAEIQEKSGLSPMQMIVEMHQNIGLLVKQNQEFRVDITNLKESIKKTSPIFRKLTPSSSSRTSNSSYASTILKLKLPKMPQI